MIYDTQRVERWHRADKYVRNGPKKVEVAALRGANLKFLAKASLIRPADDSEGGAGARAHCSAAGGASLSRASRFNARRQPR